MVGLGVGLAPQVDQPAATGSKTTATADQRPALVQTLDGVRDWLSEWRQWANTQTNRRAQSSLATSPSPSLLWSTRRPL